MFQLDERFATRLDDLVEQTKSVRAAAQTGTPIPNTSFEEKKKAACAAPSEPLSDYALRLIHNVVHMGLPPLPESLIVWPFYTEFWEEIVSSDKMENIGCCSWSQNETLDLGHAEVEQCGWGPVLRYGRHVFGGKCTVKCVRFGSHPGSSDTEKGQGVEADKKTEKGDSRDTLNSTNGTGWTHSLALQRVYSVFRSLVSAANDLASYDDIRAYDKAHPGELDVAHLSALGEAYNARIRGLLRALYYTLRYIHIHKDDLPSIPAWLPWSGDDNDVLWDQRTAARFFTDLITDGRVSEYGFHLAQHILEDGCPRRPGALIRAANKAETWKFAQSRAMRCRHCKHHKKTLSSGPDVCLSGTSTGHTAHASTGISGASWSLDVYPTCSHSATERGDSGGGGGGFSSSGGCSSGGGSSFDSGGFSSSF